MRWWSAVIIIHKSSLKQRLTTLSILLEHCVVLYCVVLFFFGMGLTDKVAFQQLSSHPCVPEYLSHRIWFLPTHTASTKRWGQYSKTAQGFTDSLWRPRPCWARANGCETAWTFPTWDSGTWCTVHPDWKPAWPAVIQSGSWTLC